MLYPPLRPASIQDAQFVAAHIRPADRQECLAATGLPPEVTLPLSVRSGALVMVVPRTGEVIGLCGVNECPIEGFGLVWMVATTSVVHHRKALIQCARLWLDQMHNSFPRLGNMVDARNTLHIRWLALLGFKFTGAAIIGPFSTPFLNFERRTRECVIPQVPLPPGYLPLNSASAR